MRRIIVVLLVMLLALLLVPGPSRARPLAATSITVSRTVTGLGGPVAAALIGINSFVPWQETTAVPSR